MDIQVSQTPHRPLQTGASRSCCSDDPLGAPAPERSIPVSGAKKSEFSIPLPVRGGSVYLEWASLFPWGRTSFWASKNPNKQDGWFFSAPSCNQNSAPSFIDHSTNQSTNEDESSGQINIIPKPEFFGHFGGIPWSLQPPFRVGLGGFPPYRSDNVAYQWAHLVRQSLLAFP